MCVACCVVWNARGLTCVRWLIGSHKRQWHTQANTQQQASAPAPPAAGGRAAPRPRTQAPHPPFFIQPRTRTRTYACMHINRRPHLHLQRPVVERRRARGREDRGIRDQHRVQEAVGPRRCLNRATRATRRGARASRRRLLRLDARPRLAAGGGLGLGAAARHGWLGLRRGALKLLRCLRCGRADRDRAVQAPAAAAAGPAVRRQRRGRCLRRRTELALRAERSPLG